MGRGLHAKDRRTRYKISRNRGESIRSCVGKYRLLKTEVARDAERDVEVVARRKGKLRKVSRLMHRDA